MDTGKTNGASTYTPNFLRVTRELAKFKDPYKAADALLLIVKDSVEDSTDTD